MYDIRMNSFRYLGLSSFEEVDDLGVDEYLMLMKAHRYKQLDKQLDVHQQAYLNHSVRATKTIGKSERSIYPKFEDFFDYEKRLQEIDGVRVNDSEDKIKIKMLNINREINDTGGE